MATTSMLPFFSAPSGMISPGSICCSSRLKMICVLETVVSMPSFWNRETLAGSLTRATVRGAWNFFFAIWQMTRLSSSSPVTATITSARAKAGLGHDADLAAVALHHDLAQLLGQHGLTAAVLFQQQDFMPFGQELLGQVIADLAPAHNDHVH